MKPAATPHPGACACVLPADASPMFQPPMFQYLVDTPNLFRSVETSRGDNTTQRTPVPGKMATAPSMAQFSPFCDASSRGRGFPSYKGFR